MPIVIAALMMLQVASPGSFEPASAPEQRADLALRRASDGRALAARFLCKDESRYRRLLGMDQRFSGMQRLFALRFRHVWTQSGEEQIQDEQLRSDELGHRDDCRLRDSFEAGFTDYENGLLAAQVELGLPQPFGG